MQAVRTLGEFLAEEQIIGWLAEQVAHNHRDSDRGARLVAKQHKLPISCLTCTAAKACCTAFVLARFYSGVLIADTLKRTSRDGEELRARLRSQADAMESTRVSDWTTRCVFLDSADRCTVYEVRPPTCGQLYVYTPPELCNARSSQIVSYTPHNEVAAADRVEEEFRERLALRRKVGRRYFGVLPRMVLVALETWDRTDFREYLRQLPWLTADEWAAVLAREGGKTIRDFCA